MKKLILILTLASLSFLNAQAGSASWTISNGAISNLLAGPVRVTSLTFQSTTTNTTQFSAIDSATTTTTNIMGSFSQITLKLTNSINTYTDYFGNTINLTNLALIHETNTIAAQTNVYPTRFTQLAGTNSQIAVGNVSYFFVNGFTVTNSGAGPVTLTVGYQQ